MNHIEISGRLVRDPELKHIGAKGTKLANFSIALTMGEGAYKKSHFFDCKCWSERAVSVCENYRKGDTIELRGMLEQETWTDKEGQKRSKVVIVVMDHRVPGERGEDERPARDDKPQYEPEPVKQRTVPPAADIDVPF